MTTQTELNSVAKRVASLLQERNLKIVFAESCTGGLISAALTRVPGVSSYHCGSAVVYQIATKAAWLGISAQVLKKPGPVSREVARQMAEGVLTKTPHADIAAAVTGHLGPDAPKRQDGLIYAAVSRRFPDKKSRRFETIVKRHLLDQRPSQKGGWLRVHRQTAAAAYVLSLIADSLDQA